MVPGCLGVPSHYLQEPGVQIRKPQIQATSERGVLTETHTTKQKQLKKPTWGNKIRGPQTANQRPPKRFQPGRKQTCWCSAGNDPQKNKFLYFPFRESPKTGPFHFSFPSYRKGGRTEKGPRLTMMEASSQTFSIFAPDKPSDFRSHSSLASGRASDRPTPDPKKGAGLDVKNVLLWARVPFASC